MNNFPSFPYQQSPGYGCPPPRTFSDPNQRSPRGSFSGLGAAPGPSPGFNFSPHHRGYSGNSSPRYTPSPGYGPGPFSRSPSPRKGQFNPAFVGRFSSPNDTNQFRTPNSSHSGGWGRGNGRKSFSRQFQSPSGVESYYHPAMVDDPWKSCNPIPVTESHATTT
ncbi:hypothetical protein ScPMuIL_016340 [Solemya velum]